MSIFRYIFEILNWWFKFYFPYLENPEPWLCKQCEVPSCKFKSGVYGPIEREHATQLFTWESWWMTGRLPFAARVLAAFRIAKFIHNLIPPIDRDQMWPVKLRLLNFAITLRLHSTALMKQNILNRVNLSNLKIGCLPLIPMTWHRRCLFYDVHFSGETCSMLNWWTPEWGYAWSQNYKYLF